MENKRYILALDAGTTSCRAILFDREGNACGSSQKEFTQYYPNAGWVEHDPMEIWSAQLGVTAEVLASCGVSADEVAAIGITNQRETTIVWDRRTGKPVYPAIVWQCRRTADTIKKLADDGLEEHVRKTTGLVPDPYFSASKIAWILANVPGAAQDADAGHLLFGTVESWLIYKLSGGKVHVTDCTNASRTMLYDIHKGCWDERLCSYFQIPASMLPEVRPSGAVYGYTDPALTGKKIPIAGAAGDQQAALFGQCCFEAGEAKNTYGTGCFLLMNTGSSCVASENGLLTTIAATADDTIQYALEGSIFSAGASIQWLRDELGVIGSAAETEAMALSVPDTAGVYLVPAFTGLGAPYWDPYARGMITGLTRGAGKNHIVRAALEAMAYQTRELLEMMEKESGVSLTGLRVDGGASRNAFLMQFQADILNMTVFRAGAVETTALGAAYLAGLTVGFWKDKEQLQSLSSGAKVYLPAMAEPVREKLFDGWKQAVARALSYREKAI